MEEVSEDSIPTTLTGIVSREDEWIDGNTGNYLS